MIKFSNWEIIAEGEVARQHDNLTRELRVEGEIPEGWTWDLLVQVGKYLDVIRLTPGENGLSVVLTGEMLVLSGFYEMQLRGTQGELVRHTNVTRVYIPESLSGDGQWPEVPSEFTQLEQAVQQSAQQAAQSAESAQKAQQAIEGMTVSAKTLEPESEATVEKTVRNDVVNIEIGVPAGKPGDPGKAGENGGYYAPAVSEDGELSWTASRLDMPAVPSANIRGPAGKDAPQINDDTVSTTNPWSSRKIVDTLAPAFESSGPVVTCTPVEGYPLHVVSQIAPVQEGEGDPSPENVRPISGWDAANLWVGGENLFSPDNYSSIKNGVVIDGEKVIFQNNLGEVSYTFDNLKPGRYGISLQRDNYAGIQVLINESEIIINGGSKPYSGEFYVSKGDVVTISLSEGQNPNREARTIFDVMFALKDVGTTYTSYNPASKIITLPFGQTVYGGTLDWTTGVLTVDLVRYIATGEENVRLGQAMQTVYRWYFEPPLPTLGNLDQKSIRCNILKTVNSGGADEMGCVCTGGNLISVLLPKDTVPDKSSAKKWLQDNQPEFVYKTSQVEKVQLTPTEILALSGANTIYTDTGDITVSGRADPKVIIQQLAARIAALEGAATNL